MNYPSTVRDVLRCEGIDNPIFLGAGEDAYVFVLSDSEAIRIFPAASTDFVSELVYLYERLQEYSFSFQYPRIYDVRTHKGIVYTIEAKLSGRPMGEVCRAVDENARRRILRNYLNAIHELAAVEMSDRDFGGLIPSAVWPTAKTWEEFLRRQLETSLRNIGSRLSEEFPDLRHTVSRLEALIDDQISWERKSLVHGDGYPGNILIDDDGKVATILDFGRYTLVGDPRIDVAIAIELTEMVAGFTPEDTAYLCSLIDDDPIAANACRAYTAILLAALYRGDARIVRKCLRSLRETVGRF
ncbi:MAG: aminoglycoside phosphotransferase family protein [Dehalococcoidia bacterium]|nr:aminoglycoside phosphotransferase family protein [Dehalococcoidia bacterium]